MFFFVRKYRFIYASNEWINLIHHFAFCSYVFRYSETVKMCSVFYSYKNASVHRHRIKRRGKETQSKSIYFITTTSAWLSIEFTSLWHQYKTYFRINIWYSKIGKQENLSRCQSIQIAIFSTPVMSVVFICRYCQF